VVAKVAFSPSTVAWTATTALAGGGCPVTRLAAATLPGRDPHERRVRGRRKPTAPMSPRDSVLYATVTNTPAPSAPWTKTTVLPRAPSLFAAAMVATPTNSAVTGASYLYVIGGDSSAGRQAPSPRCALGTLNGRRRGQRLEYDNRIAPRPVHSAGAVIFQRQPVRRRWLGLGQRPPSPQCTARRSCPTGTLGAWQALSSLPFGRSYFRIRRERHFPVRPGW